MNSRTTSTDTSQLRETLERIHRICSDFEEAWSPNTCPRIEEYLCDPTDREYLALFRDLLDCEIYLRSRAGQKPSVADYQRRFPQYESLVAKVFEEFQVEERKPTPKRAGDAVGRYEIVGVLGEGGMGTVYLAADRTLGRQVAVKVPRGDRASTNGFFEEARKAAQLKHPGIVTIHEVNREADGTPYIVMEHCGGGSLKDLLHERRSLPWERVLEILRPVAETVQHAHERQVYHRDLKPANILLDDNRQPHVADFGLAICEDEQSPRAYECSGTLPYMAPEQIRGETDSIDGRTDIWALGVIIYEMLAGRRPFTGKTAGDLARRILEADPKPLRQRNASIPAELDTICRRCLMSRKDRRYSSVADLLDDLAKITVSPGERSIVPRAIPEKWTHETTEDSHYVEPQRAVEQLTTFIADEDVRLVSVIGLGGTGKTALVAHCLKGKGSNLCHRTSGIFYWSFAANPDVDAFLESLLQFATNELEFELEAGNPEPLHAAIELCCSQAVVLILDGLEMHQEGPNEIGQVFGTRNSDHPYLHIFADMPLSTVRGRLHDIRLQELLERVSECRPSSLIIATSRYPIVDLPGSLDPRVRRVDGDTLRLSDEEGAQLLINCGAEIAPVTDSRHVIRYWEGHPLGLRVFAAATNQAGGGPQIPVELATSEAKDPLTTRLHEIASFYRDHLSPPQAALLRIVSLFSRPVDNAVIAQIALEVPVFQGVFSSYSEDAMFWDLRSLRDAGLIREFPHDETGYAYLCHPVLREPFHIRLRPGQRGRVDKTDPEKGRSLDASAYAQMQYMVVRQLLQAGDFCRADDVLRNQLNGGRLFLELGELEIGRECMLEVVGDEERRQRCESQLSEERLAYYLRMAGLFSLFAGHTEDAKTYNELAMARISVTATMEVLWNHSLIWCVTGHPDKGEYVAQTCCELALQVEGSVAMQHSLACRAFARFLQGKTKAAVEDFKSAVLLCSPSCSTSTALDGADGLLQIYCCLRAGDVMTAKSLAAAAFRTDPAESAAENHDEYLPYFRWLRGWIMSFEGDLATALENLFRAEDIATRQYSLLLLPFVLHTTADVCRKRGEWTAADDYCSQALDLAGSRRLLLVELESRILRGRIHLESAMDRDFCDRDDTETWHGEKDLAWEHSLADAMICAENALDAARQHNYRWLELDALTLLADCEEAAAAHHSRAALGYRHEGETLRRYLRPR